MTSLEEEEKALIAKRDELRAKASALRQEVEAQEAENEKTKKATAELVAQLPTNEDGQIAWAEDDIKLIEAKKKWPAVRQQIMAMVDRMDNEMAKFTVEEYAEVLNEAASDIHGRVNSMNTAEYIDDSTGQPFKFVAATMKYFDELPKRYPDIFKYGSSDAQTRSATSATTEDEAAVKPERFFVSPSTLVSQE